MRDSRGGGGDYIDLASYFGKVIYDRGNRISELFGDSPLAVAIAVEKKVKLDSKLLDRAKLCLASFLREPIGIAVSRRYSASARGEILPGKEHLGYILLI